MTTLASGSHSWGKRCFPHVPPSSRERGEPPGSPRPSRSGAGVRPVTVVREGMVPEPGHLSAEDSAQAAGELLDRPEVRAVYVTSNERLVGVVTRKTLVREVVAAGRDPSTTRLGEIAEPPENTIGPEIPLEDAFRFLEEWDAERVPVVDDEGRLIGVLSVRAAVTTGEAVVALGARPERGEGIVTGDVVNTAARLQSAAPIGGVLVDEQTMRSTESAITFEAQDPVDAKGKAEPIAVWRALRARSRAGEPEAATETPFVGREHERTLLLETFLRAERESSLQLVTVIGEPGIGKSRLVTELRGTLDDRPDLITWRHGRCLPYGEGITFWALGEIVKAEAGILESDDQHAAASKLEVTVASLFPDESERAWFGSRLGPLVGVGGEGAAVAREEAFTAWRRFLEAMAARRPCIFVFEDLHWADGALLEFLEHVLDWGPPVPTLLVCTARPELFERSPSWGGGKRNATTISLTPLSTEDAGRLLQILLDRTLLPAETERGPRGHGARARAPLCRGLRPGRRRAPRSARSARRVCHERRAAGRRRHAEDARARGGRGGS